jgi:hypothetical protein
MWAFHSGIRPSSGQSATETNKTNHSVDAGDSKRLGTPDSEPTIHRVSPRHAAGALEKHRQEKSLEQLKRAVRDQEDKVEERRKVLATIIETKEIIYRGDETSNDGDSPATRGSTVSESSVSYGDVRFLLETDQKLLEEMKLKLTEETIKLQGSGK